MCFIVCATIFGSRCVATHIANGCNSNVTLDVEIFPTDTCVMKAKVWEIKLLAGREKDDKKIIGSFTNDLLRISKEGGKEVNSEEHLWGEVRKKSCKEKC